MRIYLIFICIFLSFSGAGQSFYPPIGTAITLSGGSFNLTPAAACINAVPKGGALWCKDPVSFYTSFELTFKLNINTVSGDGADGLCVVFGENLKPTSVNSFGGYLGYYNEDLVHPNPDFDHSFALEIDHYDNAGQVNDPSPYIDHLMIAANGDFTKSLGGPISIKTSKATIEDGQFHEYKIRWSCREQVLSIYYEDSNRILSGGHINGLFINPDKVYWGFTAAMAVSCSEHIVKDIKLVIVDSACFKPSLARVLPVVTACNTVRFTVPSNSFYTIYDWNFGDGSTGSGNSVEHTFSNSGLFTIRVIATDTGGNADTAFFTTDLRPVFNAGNDTGMCVGDTVQLSVSGGYQYVWDSHGNISDTRIANPVASPSATILYRVTGIDSNNQCLVQDSVLVQVSQKPVLKILPEKPFVDCQNNTIQMTVSGATHYSWSPGIYFDDSLSATPILTANGRFMFEVTGVDSVGCAVTEKLVIDPKSTEPVLVAGAFTPGNDGINDMIHPLLRCNFIFEQFSIYNRWGQLVFHTTDVAKGWDGKYKGIPQDIGTYYYFVTGYLDRRKGKVMVKGEFILIR